MCRDKKEAGAAPTAPASSKAGIQSTAFASSKLDTHIIITWQEDNVKCPSGLVWRNRNVDFYTTDPWMLTNVLYRLGYETNGVEYNEPRAVPRYTATAYRSREMVSISNGCISLEGACTRSRAIMLALAGRISDLNLDVARLWRLDEKYYSNRPDMVARLFYGMPLGFRRRHGSTKVSITPTSHVRICRDGWVFAAGLDPRAAQVALNALVEYGEVKL